MKKEKSKKTATSKFVSPGVYVAENDISEYIPTWKSLSWFQKVSYLNWYFKNRIQYFKAKEHEIACEEEFNKIRFIKSKEEFKKLYGTPSNMASRIY